MRVLQVVRDMHPREGGPPRVVGGSAIALAQAGHEVVVAATVRNGEEAEVRASWPRLEDVGVTLRLFRGTGPSALGGSKLLHHALMEDRALYDVTHVHGIWDQVLVSAARAAQEAQRPWFVSPHGMLDRWSLTRSRWKKELALRFGGVRAMLDGASAVIFGSRDEADESVALRLSNPRAVIPNGVDLSMLDAADSDARERLVAQLPQSRGWGRIILFYARLHPKKGLDLLIEAFARVAPQFPDAALLAAGIPEDAAYEARVRAQAAQTGLGNRVCITSQFSGPDSRFLLDAASLFVLPSHQEGFSIAVIEAMARRLPVLITDRCHLPEVQREGAGLITAPTVDAIAAGLRELLMQETLDLKNVGARGQELVAERYTWQRVSSRLEQVYSQARSG